MADAPYIYRCDILRVIDGDTIDARIDLGFHMTTTQRLRLLGVNTPELHAKETEVRAAAQAAADYTHRWIDAARPVPIPEPSHPVQPWPFLIATSKSDAFGRWLATVGFPDLDNTLNAALLNAGHAVVYHRNEPSHG